MMDMEQVENFKGRCKEYLNKQSLFNLRAYGRYLQLSRPTDLRKGELIEEIVCVLCREKMPMRTKRGAPIKNKEFPKQILEAIDEMQSSIMGVESVGKEQGACEIEEQAVVLQMSINIRQLNEKQKELLWAFLNCL